MAAIGSASAGRTGVRRTVGDELRALDALVRHVAWPPWIDARVRVAISQLRHTLDEQLAHDADELPTIAARLGLDFEALQTMACDEENVQRWVSVLTGSAGDERSRPGVVAELLIVNLFPDELAYLGMLARAIGPVEEAAMAEFDGVLADGG